MLTKYAIIIFAKQELNIESTNGVCFFTLVKILTLYSFIRYLVHKDSCLATNGADVFFVRRLRLAHFYLPKNGKLGAIITMVCCKKYI